MKKVIPLLLSLLLLSGCGSRAAAQPVTGTVLAMDTVMQLTIYGSREQLDAAKAFIAQLEAACSVTDPDSEIYAINRDGSGTLSGDAADLLARALDLCERTGGALDLSIYPVVRQWGFTTGEYRVPNEDAIVELLTHVDYTKISLDEDTGAVTLAEGMEIDLGSVTKGYTGDRLAALLREDGVTSALLDLGGNVQTVGSKPDGAPWRVAVRDPFGGDYVGVLELTNQAAVTSGGYERYFEEDGQRYWHIIDPATGWPAGNGLASVTVVGDSGLVCDGLSTALFVMGPDRAAELWRESGDFEAVLIGEDGQITITEGLEDRFSPAGSAPVAVLRR